MIKHIILWNFKDGMSDAEKSAAAAKIKAGLEGLVGKIDGLLRLDIITDFCKSGNTDLMLYGEFTDEAALAGYTVNPLHVAEATYVRSVVASRKCADFEA